MQPFPEIPRFLLQVFMDKSAEGRSKSIGNTMTAKKSSVIQGSVAEFSM